MDPKTTLPDGNGACEPRPKLRRLQGACDVCKKRKIRCDSAQLPGNRCTHCTTFGLDCTHADLLKTVTSKGYVSALESRVEKMEMLLTKERGIDFTEQLENENEVEPLLHQPEGTLPRNDENNTLSESLGKLKLNPENNRFFGKSSGIQLVQTALNFQGGLCHFKHSLRGQKREEFWKVPPWIVPPPGDDSTQYTFPDSDLLPALVHLYFKEVNPFWPVLHRPTFDRKVADKLHLRDHRFGTTLLMVCSLGARYSDDPRVLLDGYGGPPFHTAGWKWHSQVCAIPKDLIYKPDLYELQTIALSAVYLQIISPTALSWNQIGFGLRRAQDVGAHRRRSEQHPTAENEQWKRVFWVLLCLEWLAGTLSGRPLAMHDQDFDQDLPVECDDEYWNLHEPQNFKQPKDKPSDLSYFICYAKLLEIQAAVATAIYSPRKPKDLCGRPFPSTEAQYIVGFDSALNSWLNNVPEHLRWDPERKNQLHLTQSALLCTAFYNVQILLHRPFIPTPLETLRSGARPSFTICTNAARSCVRIFDTCERRGIPLNFNIVPAAFAAGIVLLLNAWSGTKSGFAYNPSKELDQVYSCLRVMTEAEKRSLSAGRYTDMLSRLLYAGENPDLLFDLGMVPTVPPAAQRGFETAHSLDPDSSSQWSSIFIHHHVEDFDAASDALHAALSSRLDPQYPENWPVLFPTTSIGGAHDHLDRIYNFEPMNMDTPQFSRDLLPNTDILTMWTQVPPGFHVDDWSHVMVKDVSGPRFNHFSVPSQLQDPEEYAKLRRELCGTMLGI